MPASNKLIVLCGATATGKTALSLQLAQQWRIPIISADSRLVYREMNIGTAKPTPSEQALVHHHMVDIVSVSEHFSTAQYEQQVLRLLNDHFRQHSVALLVGGTGLYVRAVCEGLDPIPPIPEDIRAQTQSDWQQHGLAYLQNEVQRLDPAYYAQADTHNPARLLRALEVCRTTGQPFSSFRTGTPRDRPFQILKIALHRPAEQLRARIQQRVSSMIQQGLEAEAYRLYPLRHLRPLQTIGYQEFFQYFDGQLAHHQIASTIAANTWQYARRQNTWWRKERFVHWVNPDNLNELHQLTEFFLTG